MQEQVSGEELANELQTIILTRKVNTVADKLYGYVETTTQGQVDIPEFMKPLEQQTGYCIKQEINKMIQSGQLDHFYNLAVAEA